MLHTRQGQKPLTLAHQTLFQKMASSNVCDPHMRIELCPLVIVFSFPQEVVYSFIFIIRLSPIRWWRIYWMDVADLVNHPLLSMSIFILQRWTMFIFLRFVLNSAIQTLLFMLKFFQCTARHAHLHLWIFLMDENVIFSIWVPFHDFM